jgi:multifunctional CCA protein
MQIYLVGGAVRDQLLGLKGADKDWVVVGSSPEAMVAQGFIPVGKSFPVFLHPVTKEEYALARTEKKQGHGYHGFVFYTGPEVTLEEDLKRRDVTINAIAQDKMGKLIDPYGGQEDLKRGLLRHVSEAFCEDPLRVVRLARFVARFGFEVAPETQIIARKMVEEGELSYLAKERVVQELEKALAGRFVVQMLSFLLKVGFFSALYPPLHQSFSEKKTYWQPCFAEDSFSKLSVLEKTALIMSLLPCEEKRAFVDQWVLTKKGKAYLNTFITLEALLVEKSDLTVDLLDTILQKGGALKDEIRFFSLLKVLKQGQQARKILVFPEQEFWHRAIAALKSINGQTVLKGIEGKKAGEKLQQARRAVLKTLNP